MRMGSGEDQIRDFADAYNRASDRYSCNLDADLSDHGIPPELFSDVAAVCAAWASQKDTPAPTAATLGFAVGVMTGVEWERARRCR